MFSISPRNSFDLFDNFFNTRFVLPNEMKTDISENDKGYVMKVELPGVKKEDIKLSLKNGELTISAESAKNSEEKDKDGKIIRRERYCGSARRTFYVGEDITENDVKASYKDGVLRLDIPKKDVKKIDTAKYIAIE